MKILLIGPPGVGKGTQSKLICEFYGLSHISTGDILRKHIDRCTDIGMVINRFDINNGKFVPDKLINGLIKQMDIEGLLKKSYLLDGYPRTLNQAEFYVNQILDQLSKYMVIYLNASREYILDRISQRRICSGCGNVYNLKNVSPKNSGICDECGKNLIQRLDDRIDVFNGRLEIYDKMTLDVIKYFMSLNVLFEVDASREINDVFGNIKNIIGEYYDLY